MVYDCFTFNDELDLLELRLETLSAVVDKFVLVELPVNFRQNYKLLHFTENAARFAKWAEKIVCLTSEIYPDQPHPVIEHFQRRMLGIGLENVAANDLILVGDVDEIPDPEVIAELKRFPVDHPVTLIQKLYYYHVNRHVSDVWPGTVVLPRGCVKDLDCEKIRENRFNFPKAADGGWHFSWLGSAEQIAAKLRAIDVQRDAAMHGSDDISCPDPSNSQYLDLCRETGADLFGRPMTHTLVPVIPGVNQPLGIEAWLLRYPHYAAEAVTA